jgi:hypothetical protein
MMAWAETSRMQLTFPTTMGSFWPFTENIPGKSSSVGSLSSGKAVTRVSWLALKKVS